MSSSSQIEATQAVPNTSRNAALLKRLLSSELGSLKTECAQLSNDVRELVTACEQDLKTMCDALLKSCKEVNRERDDAVRLYKQEEARRRECLNQLHILRGNIRVVCRIRPTNKIDEEKGSKEIAVFRASREVVRCEGRDFEFDEVFGPKQTNTNVFDDALPMVESVFEGFHACIFAYGQTGSGKTFTMAGNASDRGVNYRAVERLFEMKYAMLATEVYSEISVYVSNVEVYNESVRDLLKNEANELQIRQDLQLGIYLPNCTRVKADTTKTVWETMEYGQKNRAQALTKMNSESSRSHSVFMVEVEVYEKPDSANNMRSVKGKLILVDLAGSERLSKSGVSGERQREAMCINKSLSALGDVIAALGSKSSHVPFRNSKLTYLLQDSMSKQNKVMMIVQTAPTLYNIQESLCTLGFGARTRSVELGRAEAKVTENIPPPAIIVRQAEPSKASVAAAAAMTKQQNEKLQLEQKVLSMERALAEMQSRATLAERALTKKDEQLKKSEREREEAFTRMNTLSQRAAKKVTMEESKTNEPSRRQIEREMAKEQVRTRLAEQERVSKEAREKFVLVTPSRMGGSFLSSPFSASANLPSSAESDRSDFDGALPLPPPITISKPVQSTSFTAPRLPILTSSSFASSHLPSGAHNTSTYPTSFGLSSFKSKQTLVTSDTSENREPSINNNAFIMPRKLQTGGGGMYSSQPASSLVRQSLGGASLLGNGPSRVFGGSSVANIASTSANVQSFSSLSSSTTTTRPGMISRRWN